MRTRRNHVQLGIERLEDRMLLAGNVTTSVIGGNLIIRGDELDNRLTIDQVGLTSHEFRVKGESFTYVNGDTAPLVVSGITRDVKILLGGAGDKLTLDGVDIPRNLIIQTGGGDDTVLVHDSVVGRNTNIRTGLGTDIVNLVNLRAKRGVSVSTSDGNDIVTLEGSIFHGKARVRTERGNDTILIQDSTFDAGKVINPGPGTDFVTTQAISASFDFRNGAQGWRAGFSDYDPKFHKINAKAGIRNLPPELGRGTGFLVEGSNRSDDLFMFLKRQLGEDSGIKPNQLYQVRLTIVFGSNVPTGCLGIGGSPGESVFLKAGASSIEPKPVLGKDGQLLMNVDKGNQVTGGPAASSAGDIGNGMPCDTPQEPQWTSIERHHIHDFLVRSDASGRLWLLVGTDSGFEGTTALYYQRIDAKLIPVADGAPQNLPVSVSR